MFRLKVKGGFAAAHQLRDYGGNCENLHGHNWKVEITVSSHRLNEKGMVIDFRRLEEILEEILGHLDHKNLNELPPFQELNPTSENICRWLYGEIEKRLSPEGIRLERVTVGESDDYEATYISEL